MVSRIVDRCLVGVVEAPGSGICIRWMLTEPQAIIPGEAGGGVNGMEPDRPDWVLCKGGRAIMGSAPAWWGYGGGGVWIALHCGVVLVRVWQAELLHDGRGFLRLQRGLGCEAFMRVVDGRVLRAVGAMLGGAKKEVFHDRAWDLWSGRTMVAARTPAGSRGDVANGVRAGGLIAGCWMNRFVLACMRRWRALRSVMME